DAQRANELLATLVKRAHRNGKLRSDVTTSDVGLLLEGCAAIRIPDPTRTSELRQRYLMLCLTGLSGAGKPPLPGPPPTPEELNWRWRQR
ncbi:MAG TPA: TetR/AcrR family transcriptional regulator, partial [Micromonosporaceae bacterium]|nr:TetR/AcrR family transcriptional regulator [Micromonosporaceae bacterium]